MFQLIFEEYKDILKSTSRRLRFWEWVMIVALAVFLVVSMVAAFFGIQWLTIVMLALTLIDTVIIAWNSHKSMKNRSTWMQNTVARAEKLKDALVNNGMGVQKGCDYIVESCDRELNSIKKKNPLIAFNSVAVSIILPVFMVFFEKIADETTILTWMQATGIVVIAYAAFYFALLQLDLTTIKTDRLKLLRDDAAYLKAKIPD